MPALQGAVPGGTRRWSPGGVAVYPTDDLFEEITYVAYHLHWPLSEILDLEHAVRRRFVEEIGRLVRAAETAG